MAGDLAREGVRPSIICKVGRWASKRAMKQYIRDGLAQRLSSYAYNPIVRQSAGRYRRRVQARGVDVSDGYDSSSAHESGVRERQHSSEGYDDTDE